MSVTTTDRPPGRILIIDTDPGARSSIKAIVKATGFTSESVASLTLGLDRLHEASFDLVIWGLALAEVRREEGVIELRLGGQCPLILIDTRYELGAGAALEVGADQVLARPYTDETMKGAIRVGMRGPRSASILDLASRVEINGMVVDVADRSIEYGGTTLVVTPREWDLLALLLAHPNQYYTLDEIIEHAWPAGRVSVDQASARIGRLRAKLKLLDLPCSIEGQRVRGYCLLFRLRDTSVATAAE